MSNPKVPEFTAGFEHHRHAHKPILILDFDGVICDSTDECIVTAWNAWMTHSGWRRSVRTVSEVPEPYRSGLRHMRSFVRTPGEYFVLIDTLRHNDSILSEEDYQRLLVFYAQQIQPFGALFLEARKRLRLEDEAHWVSLHQVYPGIEESLHRVWGTFLPFIVSSKDRASISVFFERFDVPLRNDQIFDQQATDKLAVIRTIASHRRRTLSDTVVIDDNVHHLIPVQEAGAHAMMAGWGYHTDEQIELAETHRVPIVTLETWVDAVMAETRLTTQAPMDFPRSTETTAS